MRGYPAILTEGPVSLRPPTTRDGRAWAELQTRNRAWLATWEATVPPENPYARRLTYRELVRRGRKEAAAGRMMPFNIWYAEPVNEGTGPGPNTSPAAAVAAAAATTARRGPSRMVGQMNVTGITWGSLCSAHIGYWVDERVAGRGITPTALAIVVDHCFTVIGLHRVEVNIRPENAPSRRVAEKLGFREEGVRRAYLHIDNGWRDHIAYAITAPEVPGGLLARWRSTQSTSHI
ncbi:MAG TPA: GNAT family protein [Actinocrinis sp.]|jgi:ribosomal-protein-alanine N-acetyltransferase